MQIIQRPKLKNPAVIHVLPATATCFHDLWLFGDLLEHIYDQWKNLIKFRRILPNGGQIACCIPHLQHIWS